MRNRLELRPHDFEEPSVWDDRSLHADDRYAWCSFPSWRMHVTAPNTAAAVELVWDLEHHLPFGARATVLA